MRPLRPKDKEAPNRRAVGRAASARILSAGVVVVHRQQDIFRYLLLRAFNYWDFPKGMVEPNESPLQAAVREVEEETTLTGLRFRWGDVYRETHPYNQGRKIARYYIAEYVAENYDGTIHLPPNPELGRPEHSEYRWADRAEAWELLTPRVRAILEWSDPILARAARR